MRVRESIVANEMRALGVVLHQYARAKFQARQRRFQIVRDAGEHDGFFVVGFVDPSASSG